VGTAACATGVCVAFARTGMEAYMEVPVSIKPLRPDKGQGLSKKFEKNKYA
jgi:hypothetical protein